MSSPKRVNALLTVVTNPQSPNPLHLRLEAPREIRRGQPLTLRLVAEGGTGGYVYAATSGSVPGMSSFNAITGVSTGTPTTIGHYLITATVQDTSATVVTASFSVQVLSRLLPGDVTPRVGDILFPYSYQLTVAAATGAVTWSRTGGNLPAGLTLSSSGLISGTPTAPEGISYATVRATDTGSGDTLDVPIKIQIYPMLLAFGLDHQNEIFAGVPFESDLLILVPSGGSPPFTYRFDLSEFPWLNYRPSNGLFYGIPPFQDIGVEKNFTGTATDAAGNAIAIGGRFVIRLPQAKLQPQQAGSGVGNPGPINLNFTGSAVTSVTNDGTTMTVEIDGGGGGPSEFAVEFGSGSKSGTPLPIGDAEAAGISQFAYTLHDWRMEISPAVTSGIFTLDLRKAAAGNWPPTNAGSMASGVGPSISAGVEASGDTTAWSSNTLAPGDAVDCVVVTNTAGVRWFRLSIVSER